MNRSGTRFGLRLAVVAAATCAIGLALWVAPAAALVPIDTRTTISVVSLDPVTATYSGRLTTKLKKGKPDRVTRRGARRCLKGRRVGIDYQGRQIGKAATDRKGNWSITGVKPPSGGEVKVLVARDVRGEVLCGVRSQYSQPIF